MLHSFNHSCHFTNENEFAGFSWKFPNYSMFCKMFIIMKLTFPPSPLIMLLTGLLAHLTLSQSYRIISYTSGMELVLLVVIGVLC